MIRKRHFLPATLLVLLGAAGPPVAPASAAGTQAIDATVQFTCTTGQTWIETRLRITAIAPATTAPGQSVKLTNLAGTLLRTNLVTPLPTYPPAGPVQLHAQLNGLDFTAEGGVPSVMSLTGLPLAIAPTTQTGAPSSSPSFESPLPELGAVEPATIAGTEPVVIRANELRLRTAIVSVSSPAPGPVPTPAPAPVLGPEQRCVVKPGQAPLGIVPSTGVVPDPPVVTSLSQEYGPVNGQNTITIRGDHFASAESIRFVDGGHELQPYGPDSFTVIDDETIEFTLPDRHVGDSPEEIRAAENTVDIVVTTAFGTSEITPADLYSFGGPRVPVPTITSISPNRLPMQEMNASFELTIHGTGLDRIKDGTVTVGPYRAYDVEPSVDGTTARAVFQTYSAPPTAGFFDLTFQGTGPCATSACVPEDTEGNDFEFYDPSVLSYSLKGNATLKTLVKGSLPLTGSLDAVTFDTASPSFSADLFLEQSTAKLLAIGFLPVTAQVLFLPTAPMVGSLEGGVLKATQKTLIQIPKVTLFGIPIAGGMNCRAKQVSNIVLKSVAPNFVPATGGVLAGSFAISDLSGCGSLTGLISPLTAGKGNAIALNLTPTPVV